MCQSNNDSIEVKEKLNVEIRLYVENSWFVTQQVSKEKIT
jgi:hypothetical protein